MNRINSLLILPAFIIAGCSHDRIAENHDHDVSQETEEIHENPSFTVYSGRYELFAETTPFEEGNVVEVNAHFTEIQNGHEPLSGATVTLLLKDEGSVLLEADGYQKIPGIYGFELGPLTSVRGDLLFIVDKNNVRDTLRVSHFHSGGENGYTPSAGGSADITFTKEQAWNAKFRVEPVTEKPFSEVVLTSGEMQAMPGEKQNVIAKSNGIILFSTSSLVQGSSVKKGDLLFTLSGQGLAVNNVSVQFNEAKTRYMLSRDNYQRQKALYADKVVSEKQYREYESKYITDSVAYFSLTETVSSQGMNVHAPMTGYLHELNVTEGQFVETGQKLATLSANRIMLLRADLPQQHFKLLDRITTTTFRPAYSEKVYTLDELNGRLLAKGASVAENNHYMPVYFEVTNDGSLLEGAYAEFYLKTDPVPGRIVIPVSSLVEEQNTFYVYVQTAGETFQKRVVSIGASDGLSALVSDGLETGERIVTEGAMLIKTASMSTAPAHTHQH